MFAPAAVSLNQTDAIPEPVHYLGPPNAFLLEMFAMHPDYDERYGFNNSITWFFIKRVISSYCY